MEDPARSRVRWGRWAKGLVRRSAAERASTNLSGTFTSEQTLHLFPGLIRLSTPNCTCLRPAAVNDRRTIRTGRQAFGGAAFIGMNLPRAPRATGLMSPDQMNCRAIQASRQTQPAVATPTGTR